MREKDGSGREWNSGRGKGKRRIEGEGIEVRGKDRGGVGSRDGEREREEVEEGDRRERSTSWLSCLCWPSYLTLDPISRCSTFFSPPSPSPLSPPLPLPTSSSPLSPITLFSP